MFKEIFTGPAWFSRGSTTKKRLAFVLGGGGGRGALQVGAMRALLEAGLKPDLLVGTSIGAVNATGLALWGVNPTGIKTLEHTWQEASDAYLMDSRLSRLMLHYLLRRHNTNTHAYQQISQFLTTRGITPDLRFEQIAGVSLALVSSDLASGQPVIYGQDPKQSVLEGLLASVALPPWFDPIEKDGRHIVDGGFLSNLPIEPALTMGATEIIALDLGDPDPSEEKRGDGFSDYIDRLRTAIIQRQVNLETALAEARGVPVHYVLLKSPTTNPLWDFGNYQQLISTGYDITSQQIPGWVKSGRAFQPSRN